MDMFSGEEESNVTVVTAIQEKKLILKGPGNRKSADDMQRVCHFDMHPERSLNFLQSAPLNSPTTNHERIIHCAPNEDDCNLCSKYSDIMSPSKLLKSIMDHILNATMHVVHYSIQQQTLQDDDVKADLGIGDLKSQSFSMTDEFLSNKLKRESFTSDCVVEKDITVEDLQSNHNSLFKMKPCSPQLFTQEDYNLEHLPKSVLLPFLENDSEKYDDYFCQKHQEQPTEELSTKTNYECDRATPVSQQQTSDTKLFLICQFCQKNFADRYNRDRHIVSQSCMRYKHRNYVKSTGEVFICELCPLKTFPTKKKAETHSTLHKLDPRTCPVCEESFRDRTIGKLIKHVRKYHSEYLP